ncbi:uncharacterized protein PpBr36_11282 [Pyricularia pennisetigena]|uniref:uncharacterized protein n=1 Tax=Pyricularia pennisetigena TaxID=1578925 RepID=UPI001151108F|nr:uncharacterized protein PpBr36_11282 [Pyricularia pennisetigena]TLS20432.1 hypothetical protein PpBr36_11282 [Pyricularia pennisetigena]
MADPPQDMDITDQDLPQTDAEDANDHSKALCSIIGMIEVHGAERATSVIYQQQHNEFKNGNLKQAVMIGRLGLEAMQKVVGREDPSTLTCLANLSALLAESTADSWNEAEFLGLEAFTQRQQVLGPHHRHTLRSLLNLAAIYRKQAKFEPAERLYRQALGYPQSGLTLEFMAGLLSTCRHQGRKDEAETLARQILEIREALYQEGDTKLLAALLAAKSDLAGTLAEQCQYDEAKALVTVVRVKRLQVLGPRHLDTLASTADLGAILICQSEWVKAEQVLHPVALIMEQELGKYHQYTLSTKSNLAKAFTYLDRYEEAETLQLELLNIRKQALGEEHPDTLACLADLTSTYLNRSEFEKAEQNQLELVGSRVKVLGVKHRDTLVARANLLEIYDRQGRHLEAVRYGESVVEDMMEILGKKDQETLIACSSLAWAYCQLEQYAKAHNLNISVAEKTEKKLGPDHPQTVEAKANLAFSHAHMGNPESAKKLALEVFGRKELPVNSYSRRMWINNLCTVLTDMQSFDIAEQLGNKVLSGFEKAFGPNHRDTIVAKSNLALVYKGQGKLQQAHTLAREAAEKSSIQLGKNHPVSLIFYAKAKVSYNGGHQNIIKFHGLRVHRGRITGIVLKKHDRTLKQCLESDPAAFAYLDRDAIISGLQSAVTFLHSLKLAHNDISPYNVMIDEKNQPVLIDFGSCGTWGQHLQTCGTKGFSDQEFCISKQRNDFLSLNELRGWMKREQEKVRQMAWDVNH